MHLLHELASGITIAGQDGVGVVRSVRLDVRDGRLEKGMQSFGTSPQVMENMNQLYAYLKGRSDGAITRAKVEPMP